MRNITLRQLRTISAVFRHGKVNLAARELGLTGPAVSLQIQQFEQSAGLLLFERTRDGMVPTEAGRAAYEAARAIRSEISHLEDALNAIKGLGRGKIRLGVVSTGKYFAPKLIAGFLKEVPGIELKLFVGNRAETIAKLKNHEIDIALMGRPPKEIDVRSRVFGDHPLVFIAPAGHKLSQEIEITKERIAQEQFIVREKGSGTRISLEIFMSDVPGRLDNLGTEMDSNETIKQAVMAGLGIAFISGHTIEQECQSGKLVILDVVQTPIRRQWFAVTQAAKTPTPALQALDDFLRKTGPSLLPIVSKPYRTATSQIETA